MRIKIQPILLSSILLLAVGISACSKKDQPTSSTAAPNNQPATVAPAGTPPQSATDANAAAPADAAPVVADKTPSLRSRATDEAPAAAPAPVAIVIPAGSTLRVRLDSSISTKTAQVGQAFNATLSSPITKGDRVLVPSGTPVSGEVTQAKEAGRFKGGAVLSLRLTAMTLRGRSYDLATSSITQASKARGKRTLIGTGGGAALGGLIGGLVGGGKGLAIGAASGAGAGAAGSAFTGNREVVLPAETPLSFHTTAAVTLR